MFCFCVFIVILLRRVFRLAPRTWKAFLPRSRSQRFRGLRRSRPRSSASSWERSGAVRRRRRRHIVSPPVFAPMYARAPFVSINVMLTTSLGIGKSGQSAWLSEVPPTCGVEEADRVAIDSRRYYLQLGIGKSGQSDINSRRY